MPAIGPQFRQIMAAREEYADHAHASGGDVNPLGATSFGTQSQLTAWRRQHSGDTIPQPIRSDNQGSFNFKQPTEYQPVKGYSGRPAQPQ